MSETVSPQTNKAAMSRWRRWPVLRSRRIRIWAAAVLLTLLVLGLQSAFPDFRLLPNLAGSLGTGTAIALFLAAMFCEYIDSSLGMGYGTTLTPVLLLVGFEPLQIVPCVLLSEFITGLGAALMHHRDGNVNFVRDRKARGTAILLSLLSVVGTVAAVTLALKVPKFWLKAIIGVIIVSVGVVTLTTIKRRLRYRRGHIIALGAVAAFNKGLSGGGYGPLVTAGQVVSGLPPKHAVAITSLAESFTCAVGLVAYMLIHGSLDWTLAAPLTLGAVLSVPIATLTVRKLPEAAMRMGVGIVACALGIFTIVKLLV